MLVVIAFRAVLNLLTIQALTGLSFAGMLLDVGLY
jgi:hypothetical protein